MKPDCLLRRASDRAALERIAARDPARAARRARMVLAAADGVPIRELARREGVDRNTVRLWLRRFAAAGVAGLEDRPGRGRPRGRSARGGGRAGGPRGAVRLDALVRRIRDRIATGAVRPGARLPAPAAEAARRGVGETTLRRAYRALEREGFLVPGARGAGPAAADDAPDRGRHLLVLGAAPKTPESLDGFDRALRAAAKALGAARGVAFDEARPGRDVSAPDYARLRADCLRRRWQGVFFRNFAAEETDHPASIPRLPGLPMSGCWLRPRRISPRVLPVEGWGGVPDRVAAALVEECRAAGRRQIVFLAARTPQNEPNEREAALRAAAARAGLRCGPFGFQTLSLTDPAQTRRLFDLLVSHPLAAFDAVAVLNDNLLRPFCDALLAARGAARARRVFLASHGNAPLLPEVPLPVVFRGVDATATLVSYLDWSDALRAGERKVPGPAVAFFREDRRS
ncbi:MAG: helix-turn-helix domain-containing protein [Kiritimatiellae bacterium]|nr:helix-turn-helix domain-containing protein [Kiritimatiellia bacterium]